MQLRKALSLFQSIEPVLKAEEKKKLAILAGGYFEMADNNFTLREKIFKLEQTIHEKEREIEKLEDALTSKNALVHKPNGYYYQNPDVSLIGPICPDCYENKGFISLLSTSPRGAFCSACKTHYQGVQASVEGYKQSIR